MVRKWLHLPGLGICDAFLREPIKIWGRICPTKNDSFSQIGGFGRGQLVHGQFDAFFWWPLKLVHQDSAVAKSYKQIVTGFGIWPWPNPKKQIVTGWQWPNPKNKLWRVSRPRTFSCASRPLRRGMLPPCGEVATPTSSTSHEGLDVALQTIAPASVRGYKQPSLKLSNCFFPNDMKIWAWTFSHTSLGLQESSVPTLRAKSCQQIGRWEYMMGSI